MHLKIISCELFKLYIEKFNLNQAKYEIVYLDIYSHDNPVLLNEKIQSEINKPTKASKIVLLYGICGNALKGLYTNEKDVIIPRFHDCSQILLGSLSNFKAVFKENYSRPWSCANYKSAQTKDTNYETNLLFLDLVSKYGRDDAKYIYETMYISNFETDLYLDFGLDIDKKNIQEKEYEVISGSLEILKKVFSNEFDDNFVTLTKEKKLKLLYDLEKVIEVV